MSRGIVPDPWAALRRRTPARIALGRAGDSLPTAALLEFGLAQARARDAVHQRLDLPRLASGLRDLAPGRDTVVLEVQSAAVDRATYLRRPDLGRALDARSRTLLAAERDRAAGGGRPRLVLVVADGLSATAVNRHALPVLEALRPHLAGWRVAAPVIAREARVALGDEIGALLGAEQVAVLIGERPGLSSPDSLGIYLTHAPCVGRTDAERNCISNIRPEGLGYDEAARRLALLLAGAYRLGRSGVELKDESDRQPTESIGPPPAGRCGTASPGVKIGQPIDHPGFQR